MEPLIPIFSCIQQNKILISIVSDLVSEKERKDPASPPMKLQVYWTSPNGFLRIFFLYLASGKNIDVTT